MAGTRLWCVAAVLAGGVVSAALAQEEDEDKGWIARAICSAPGSNLDYSECVPQLLARWDSKTDKSRQKVVAAQTLTILKACPDQQDGAFASCARQAAVAMGTSYEHPAAALAVWKRQGEVLDAAIAPLKPILAACRRAGWEDGQPKIGMTSRQAEVCGWGAPASRRKETTAAGTTEVWRYSDGRYLKLKDHRVQAIGE